MTGRMNVLITGTKAGVGLGLLKHYASLPETTVIAAIRDEPMSEVAKSMASSVTTTGRGSRIVPVQYDAALVDSADNMIQVITKEHPDIQHLNLVIANAATNTQWGPVSSVSATDLTKHFTVNTVGPLMLYQATRKLLLASSEDVLPRFCLISTVAASIESMPRIKFPVIAYGMSKVAGNYFIRKADLEEERLALIAVHPGWVQSESGNEVARRVGIKEAPLSIDRCVEKLTTIVGHATKRETGGTFQSIDGGTLPW